MAALTGDRDTKEKDGKDGGYPVKGATKIWAGSMAAVDATGYLVPAAAVAAHKVVGASLDRYDNTSGANGDIKAVCRRSVFRFNNSTSGDLIALTDIGANCYVVDDQTVAKTDATATRPRAGKVFDVDALGVWVDFR